MIENRFFINHDKYDRVEIGKIGDRYYIVFLDIEKSGRKNYAYLWHDGEIHDLCAHNVPPSPFEGYYSTKQQALDKYHEWYRKNIKGFSELQGKRKLYYFKR